MKAFGLFTVVLFFSFHGSASTLNEFVSDKIQLSIGEESDSRNCILKYEFEDDYRGLPDIPAMRVGLGVTSALPAPETTSYISYLHASGFRKVSIQINP